VRMKTFREFIVEATREEADKQRQAARRNK
jgi:hypothetical protein